MDKAKIVCCSTDAGGGKFVIKLAGELGVHHAIATKFRSGTSSSSIVGISGIPADTVAAFIVDDETVTFGSLQDTARALCEQHGIRQLFVLCSHNKVKAEFVHRLKEAHEKFGVQEIHFTDSVPSVNDVEKLSFVTIHSLAEHFALTINRHHCNLSVSEAFRG